MKQHYNILEAQFFDSEPFSKREAFNWLINKVAKAELKISTRYLGMKWNWDKSRVSRFLKFLKEKDIIETEIVNGKILIKLKPVMDSQDSEKQTRGKNETVLSQDTTSAYKNTCSNADSETLLNQHLAIENTGVDGSFEEWSETMARQFQDTALAAKKERRETKEKNQKKEKRRKEEIPKEKSSLLERAKKEKESEFSSTMAGLESTEFMGFAESIDLTKDDLLWEKAKFEDYLRASNQKPPNDIHAAFRNWLRRTRDFGSRWKVNQRSGDKRTSYEIFLDGAKAAVEQHKLRRQHAQEVSEYAKNDPNNAEYFLHLQTVS